MYFRTLEVVVFVLGISDFGIAKVTLPPDLQEYATMLHDVCLKKTGISEDEHAAYDIETNKDPKMMCYMNCLMLEAQWMSTDGNIEYQFIEDTAHSCCKDILVNALNKCHDIPEGADLCEKSYNFNHCMKQADPENWFFV